MADGRWIFGFWFRRISDSGHRTDGARTDFSTSPPSQVVTNSKRTFRIKLKTRLRSTIHSFKIHDQPRKKLKVVSKQHSRGTLSVSSSKMKSPPILSDEEAQHETARARAYGAEIVRDHLENHLQHNQVRA